MRLEGALERTRVTIKKTTGTSNQIFYLWWWFRRCGELVNDAAKEFLDVGGRRRADGSTVGFENVQSRFGDAGGMAERGRGFWLDCGSTDDGNPEVWVIRERGCCGFNRTERAVQGEGVVV